MTDLPATMRAAWLHGPGHMELREVPVPRPGPGEVLVKVEAALTCGTDVKTFQRGHARLPMPAPFGHEFAGTIAAAGAGVTFAEGARIMCVPTAPCGACAPCLRGRENLCPHAVGRMVLGAYADYVLLPAHIVQRHLFERPAHLDARHAALLEPLACVVQGMARIDSLHAAHVVILGDGPIALLFAALFTRTSVTPLMLGRHDSRLAVARGYGAATAIAPDDAAAHQAVRTVAANGADLVVECVGTPQAWRLASELAAPGGTVLLFGGCAAGAQACFDATRLHYDEVTITSSFHYGPAAVQGAVTALEERAFDPAPLVTHEMPLEKLDDALALMASRTAIKVAVLP
ncbi:MAG TPA: alcohol dehydrogenase catalytic domain-containing protein [Longimicrobiales bacterium]|nr:alcohol dehydrogenase catalytic domain-containing protein [Longimicrobiales bacterium]